MLTVCKSATGKPKVVRINAAALSEDDADHLFYLKHRHEKRRRLEELRAISTAGFSRPGGPAARSLVVAALKPSAEPRA